ncbi:MAG: hypothetical protein HKN26_00010 [Acidimicrobiales bacterium]|nr:hypothetical protein [Acidimicrobiales bacterium]
MPDRPTSSSPIRVPFGIKALLVANFLHTFAFLGLYTFVGDQVFSITGRELDLGLLGLVIFLPVFILSPLSGTIVDRFDRRFVYAGAIAVEIAVATGLYFHIRSDPDSTGLIFALVACYGAA